ncbi:hypothetical protein ABPG74_009115 [Tetrahymena malaccensis]
MKRKQNEAGESSDDQSQEIIYKKQELNDKQEEKKVVSSYNNNSKLSNQDQKEENSNFSNGSTDNLSKPPKDKEKISLASKYTPQQIEQLKLQYLNEKNLKKLVELCQPLTDIYKEYQKLKYKNKIYSINDLVLIQNADDLSNDFIGQLIKIIRIENQGKYITLIQIKWYYKKDDLPQKKFGDDVIECISDNEIFETDHLDITFVDCINGPCKLYNYQEYDQLKSISQNTFFTRAKFDTVKKKLIPPFEKWETGCICKRPLNPDYLYIQCEKCEKWFHITCINISEKDLEKIENYKCPFCNQNAQNSAKPSQVNKENSNSLPNQLTNDKQKNGEDKDSSQALKKAQEAIKK